MNKKSNHVVLLIEDNPGDARLIREMFREPGSRSVDLVHVCTMSDAEKRLAETRVELILLDLGLPDAQGLGAVRRARAAAPHVPLVVLSGLDDESMAVQALQEGAQDYLIKGQIEPRQLIRALHYAVERKKIDESLFEEKERAQATLNCIGDAIVTTDMSGNIAYLNLIAENMTGWLLEEADGRPVFEVFRVVDATTREATPDPMARAIEQNLIGHLPLNRVLVRRDGSEVSVEGSASPIRDRDGQSTGAVMVVRDVSAVRAMSEQIAFAAAHDFLTGLPNRWLLNERIDQAIALAKRNNYKIAVLYLDLDGFKHINDALGHPFGDKVLKSIAERLLNCVRAPDTVSRQGGDEFLVLLSEVQQPDGSANLARRLLSALGAAHCIDGRELHVTASVGVSVYPDDGLDPETLIKCADIAMYQAKESGRQSYQFFTPAMHVRAVERQSIEEDLRRALERNELTLHYQPKVNLKSRAIIGVEALLRWTHPVRGPISPATFIPIAEECGLILPIGTWVLEEACRQARVWLDAGLPGINVAVNVSGRQFQSENFEEKVMAVLHEFMIDPVYLEVEVTESLLMKAPELTATLLQSLRGKGVRVAIDDFGTGYSSLSYLRRFPIDTLKIDQSFVRQIDTPGGLSMVRAIIDLGRNLGMRLVAEGVETELEATILEGMGCDRAQGYYFSRPLVPEKLASLLQANASAQ